MDEENILDEDDFIVSMLSNHARFQICSDLEVAADVVISTDRLRFIPF